MMNLFWSDLYDVSRALNRVFDERRTGRDVYYYPEINSYENDDEYVVAVKAPGMKKADFGITFKDNSIKISGERKKEKNEKLDVHLEERFGGKFERSIMLPERVHGEKIAADFKNGLLMLKLPKSAETKPKEIKIN